MGAESSRWHAKKGDTHFMKALVDLNDEISNTRKDINMTLDDIIPQKFD